MKQLIMVVAVDGLHMDRIGHGDLDQNVLIIRKKDSHKQYYKTDIGT